MPAVTRSLRVDHRPAAADSPWTKPRRLRGRRRLPSHKGRGESVSCRSEATKQSAGWRGAARQAGDCFVASPLAMTAIPRRFPSGWQCSGSIQPHTRSLRAWPEAIARYQHSAPAAYALAQALARIVPAVGKRCSITKTTKRAKLTRTGVDFGHLELLHQSGDALAIGRHKSP